MRQKIAVGWDAIGGGGRGVIREQVVEKIQRIVDEFEGLDVKS